jgi:hypothetical protein
VPLHFTAFHPDWKMTDLPPTPPAPDARPAASPSTPACTTSTPATCTTRGRHHLLPDCHAALIVRDWYEIRRYDLTRKATARTARPPSPVAPAAIRAAAQRDTQVRAVACHGGLIDRAGAQALELLIAPLLMLIDADDDTAFAAYRRAATAPALRTRNAGDRRSAKTPENRVAIWFSRFFYALRGLTVAFGHAGGNRRHPD